MLHRLDPRAGGQLPRRDVPLLHDEQPHRRRVDGRNERFFAERRELAVAELNAECPAPLSDGSVQHLDAQLARIVRELRADRIALELDVLVVVDTQSNVDAFDDARKDPPSRRADRAGAA